MSWEEMSIRSGGIERASLWASERPFCVSGGLEKMYPFVVLKLVLSVFVDDRREGEAHLRIASPCRMMVMMLLLEEVAIV